MLVFEKPENTNKEDLKEVIAKDNKIKARVGFLMIVFLTLIIFLAQNDFNFDAGSLKTNLIDFRVECEEEYYHKAGNDPFQEVQKAKRVINANLVEFQQMRAFREIYVEEELKSYGSVKEPVIKIGFEGVSSTDERIPEMICGFRVSVIYK